MSIQVRYWLIGLTATALLVSGCSNPDVRPATAAPTRAVSAPTVANPGTDRLELVVAGIARPVSSDAAIPVAGDLLAGLKVHPGEARHSRTIDLYLYQRGGRDAPVENASVQATGRMRYMDHGTFRRTALPAGGGHYLVPLPFAMPGEWQVDLEITTLAKQPASIRLNIDLID